MAAYSTYAEFDDGSSDEEPSEDAQAVCCESGVCRCCCAASLLALLCTGILTAVLAPVIGRRVAEEVTRDLNINFSSVDIGVINGTSTFSPHIVALVTSPSGQIPFPAKLLPMRAVLKASTDETEDMMTVGTVSIPEVLVVPNEDLVLNLTGTFEVEFPDAFGRAGKHFIASRRTSWLIEAKVDVECLLLGVPWVLRGISLHKPISLQGLGGFSQETNPVIMEDMTDAYGQTDALFLTVSIRLHNPSYMAAYIAPQMQFVVMQRGHMFGTALIEDLRLSPGANVISLKFLLTDTLDNQDAVRAFILGYIKAEVQPVAVFGSANSTADSFLNAILGGMHATFNFKAPPTQFLRGVEASIGLPTITHTLVFNPLPRAITMGSLDLVVREHNAYGHQIIRIKTYGAFETDIPGAVLHPKRASDLFIRLNPFEVELLDTPLVGRLISAAVEGRVAVRVNGPVTITIQPSFTVTLDYSADNITAILECPLLCAHG